MGGLGRTEPKKRKVVSVSQRLKTQQKLCRVAAAPILEPLNTFAFVRDII